MKKTTLTLLAACVAVSAFSQGTVVFNNRVAGTIVNFIYGPQAGDPYASLVGNTSAATPAGTQVYTGALLTGSGYRAQLFAATGFNQAEGSLVAASSAATSFRTGTAAGNIAGTTAVLSGVASDAPQATLQVRVWDNTSGLYADWASASVAWQAGLIAAGMSNPWNQNAIGGNGPAPNLINLADTTQYMQGFNIYMIPVPEPSTFVLAGLGAAGLLIFRRRK